MEPLELVRLPVPPTLRIALAHPDMPCLHEKVARCFRRRSPAVALHQAAQVGAIVAAAHSGDLALLGRAIDDRIAEPARGPLLPGFAAAKAAALAAGGLGCSISGSGPTAFAIADSDASATRVAAAMGAAYRALGLRCVTRIAIPTRGEPAPCEPTTARPPSWQVCLGAATKRWRPTRRSAAGTARASSNPASGADAADEGRRAVVVGARGDRAVPRPEVEHRRVVLGAHPEPPERLILVRGGELRGVVRSGRGHQPLAPFSAIGLALSSADPQLLSAASGLPSRVQHFEQQARVNRPVSQPPKKSALVRTTGPPRARASHTISLL